MHDFSQVIRNTERAENIGVANGGSDSDTSGALSMSIRLWVETG